MEMPGQVTTSDTAEQCRHSTWVALIRLSRWRFWTYLAGPYLVGFAAGASSARELASWWFAAHLVYFLFPANLVLYGINDLFDFDTDALNPKKGSVEHRLRSSELCVARNGVLAGLAITVVVTAAQRTTASALILLSFAALAVFYSTPPFRLKARPALDSLSNILYALPGFLGYAHASGHPPALTAVIIAALWTSAMHLFSAIPDIESDRQAGLRTSATVLGFGGSLIACAVLWAMFAAWILHSGVLWPWSLAALVYPAVPFVMLFRGPGAVLDIYWRFPVINASIGMLAFFAVVLSK